MLAQRYALVVGVVLLLTGLLGLVLGEQLFLGILNIDILEDVVHLATGGLLAYAGLARDAGLARTLVGALGVIYLGVGILGFVVPMMFGLLPDGYTIFDNLLHLALGIVGIAVALASRPATTAEAR